MPTSLSRRDFVKATAAVSAPCLTARAAAAQQPPNLLLIVAEDMGLQLGCYGDATVPTPNLDELAQQGILFSNAYVTQASCSPSRASLLTGLYPHENNQLGLAHWGYRMHSGIPNLPALLKQRGYRTGILGKLHVSPEKEFPFDYNGGGHSKDVRAYAAKAAGFLDETGDQPFFLYVNFGDCHKPYAHQFAGLPERPVTPADVQFFPEHDGVATPKLRDEVAGYYNGVQRVDFGVGLLLQLLEERKLTGDTLVMFLGDHGPAMSRGKTTTYEFGVRVPCLAQWPGRTAAGHRSAALVSTVDVLPTLVTAAGGELPTPLSGHPLQPLLAGEGATWREYLATEWHAHGPGWAPQRAIRDSRYKLILNLRPDLPKPGLGVDGCAVAAALKDAACEAPEARRVFALLETPPPVELYDLQEDPIEYDNLAGKPEYAEIERRLSAALQAWREETRDPLLDPAVEKAYGQHYADYVRTLPERKKQVKPDKQGRRRVPIDMQPFQRKWTEIVKVRYPT